MNLLATQSGTTKKVAGKDGKTIDAPCFETIDVTDGETSYNLKHTPLATPKVYELKGDGTIGDKVNVSTTAAGKTIVIADKAVTLAAGGFTAGSQLFFMYDYRADGTTDNGAVEVMNTATKFPVGCKFIMEILGCNVCDQTNLIYAYLVFPNAKLSPDFDWSINLAVA